MPTKTSLKEETTKEEIVSAAGEDIVVGTTPYAMVPQTQAGVSGDFDLTDITFPKLQLVHGIGPLSDEFAKGGIVLDGETLISDGDQEVDITVVKIAKMFEENIPFETGEIPRIVATKAELLELGGDTEYGPRDPKTGKSEPPSWKPIADALICIKDPTGEDDTNFPYEYEGDNYAFAMWRIKNSAYRRAAVPIFTAATMYYRQGLRTGSFKLTTEKAKFGQNTVVVPKLVKGTRHSEDFVAWLGEFA
tara:strand:+ start:678 stop:1421 length:744 start_codon:yes stop_codon:yes gene_type:complete